MDVEPRVALIYLLFSSLFIVIDSFAQALVPTYLLF